MYLLTISRIQEEGREKEEVEAVKINLEEDTMIEILYFV
jgi:hypothetical protein